MAYKTWDELREELIEKMDRERVEETQKLNLIEDDSIRKAHKWLSVCYVMQTLTPKEITRDGIRKLLKMENTLLSLSKTCYIHVASGAEEVKGDIRAAVKRIEEEGNEEKKRNDWNDAKNRLLQDYKEFMERMSKKEDVNRDWQKQNEFFMQELLDYLERAGMKKLPQETIDYLLSSNDDYQGLIFAIMDKFTAAKDNIIEQAIKYFEGVDEEDDLYYDYDSWDD